MRSSLAILFAISLTACSGPEPEVPPQASASAGVRRGLWVLAEGTHRTLERPERIEGLVRDAERVGVTDLFVQVYRAGRSWYPSTHADPAPYDSIRRAGIAPLEALVTRAHASGLRVHGWFNALCLHQNSRAPLLRTVGRGAVLIDRKGRSLLDYPHFDVPPPDHAYYRLGTPGIWLDPAVPGVAEALEAIVDDLVKAAPDLDGLHLDFIRYPYALPITPGSRFEPGLDFGYGDASKARFAREHGGRFESGDAWDAFRRERVGEIVRRLHTRLPQGWELSAAVLPWAERAYLSAFQDWRRWLEDGALDFAVVMAYVRDDRLLRYLAQGLRGGVAGDRVWLGLGSWLFEGEPARIRAQAEIVLAANPPGIAFFSYDAVVGAEPALEAVAASGPGAQAEGGVVEERELDLEPERESHGKSGGGGG
jgi:uncharacterized lipoprotein YddW (UPF0748 family)